MKLPAIAAWLLLSAITLAAQHMDNPAVDGLLIYKQRNYYPDSLAVAVEYTNVSNFPHVTHVFLLHGGHIQLPPDADTLFIVYPGRSGETKEDVMPLLDMADARFPQYRGVLAQIRNEWKLMTPKKAASAATASTAAASQARNNWAQNVIATLSHAVHSALGDGAFKSAFAPTPPLDAASLETSKPAAASAGPKPQPDASPQKPQTSEQQLTKEIEDYQ